MISHRIVSFFRNLVNTLHKLKAFPIMFDRTIEKYALNFDRIRYLHIQVFVTFIHFIHILFHIAFLLLQKHDSGYLLSSRLLETVACMAVCISYCYFLLFQIITAANPAELVTLINTIESFCVIHNKIFRRSPIVSKLLHFVLKQLDVCNKITFLVMVLMTYFYPQLPIFMSGLLTGLVKQDFWNFYLFVKVVYSLTYIYHALNCLLLCGLYGGSILASFVMFTLLITNGFNANSVLQSMDFYRKVKILLYIYLDFYGFTLLVLESGLAFGITVYSVLITTFGSSLRPTEICGILVCWTIFSSSLALILETSGRFEHLSEKRLKSWKRGIVFDKMRPNQMLKHTMKRLRSMTTLRYNFKGYRKVKRLSIFIEIKAITRNTFRAVAATRS